MRGSHFIPNPDNKKYGIIPAHAGLTKKKFKKRVDKRDHPRACGAHRCCQRCLISSLGSSPRMRGSQLGEQALVDDDGIIPAHAGLTSVVAMIRYAPQDHPRACGAHSHDAALAHVLLGSSPRMRGSLDLYFRSARVTGIIPAHAGLTTLSPACARPHGDHPRACGAHHLHARSCEHIRGSSPRMRGSPHGIASIIHATGIIPAHAGLTTRTSSRHAREVGSSPRMRGSRLRAHNRYRQLGIIPAHAGLTTPSLMTRRSPWDHPRACGAHQQST